MGNPVFIIWCLHFPVRADEQVKAGPGPLLSLFGSLSGVVISAPAYLNKI